MRSAPPAEEPTDVSGVTFGLMIFSPCCSSTAAPYSISCFYFLQFLFIKIDISVLEQQLVVVCAACCATLPRDAAK